MTSHSVSITNLDNSKFKQVCVYGGKESGKAKVYKHTTTKLTHELIARKLDLVYSGGVTSLIGAVTQTLHSARGHVLSIVLTIDEKAFGEQRIVLILHQQKAEMTCNTDCFVVLLRGFKIIKELMETDYWAQPGIHDKPIGLLNVGHFFNDFLAFIDIAIENGYIKPSQKGFMVLSTNANELLRRLGEYELTHESSLPKELWEARAKSSSSTYPTK